MKKKEIKVKKMFFALLSLSTLAIALALWAPGSARAETTTKFEPKQLREDFQIARKSLEEGHPGLYRYTNKAELDRIFDETEKSLDHPMDFCEFYRLMALPIAAIKCGHTDISLSPDVSREMEQMPQLPFDVRILGSKAYVFRDYAKGGTLAGMEIESINGVPVTHILSTMFAAESQDGDILTSRRRVISQHFGLNIIVLLGLREPYEVMLVDSGTNKVATVHVAGLKHEDMVRMSKTLYPQDQGSKKFADLEFLDDGKIAHLTYSAFGENVEEGKSFIKGAFETIHSKGSRALILDVRYNLGGEGELGEVLYSYLVGTPFKYYDDMIVNDWRFSYFPKYTEDHKDFSIPKEVAELRADGKVHAVVAPLLGMLQPSKPTFTGPVYILINGGSFSTTAEFLTEVHCHRRAKFIGEESGGAYYGNNSGTVARITLPNTKLGVFIPLVGGYMFVEGHHEHEAARGVIPDYPVERTIADLLAGVDRDFELALTLARKSQ